MPGKWEHSALGTRVWHQHTRHLLQQLCSRCYQQLISLIIVINCLMLSMSYLSSSEGMWRVWSKISSSFFFICLHWNKKCIPAPQNAEQWHDSWGILNQLSVHINLGFLFQKWDISKKIKIKHMRRNEKFSKRVCNEWLT